MRRTSLLALLVLLGSSTALAELGASKEVEAKNFKWALPSKAWSFRDPSPDEQKGGYVAVAVLGDNVRADVRVVPAEKLALAEISGEVRDSISLDFVTTKLVTVTKAKLSGLDGSVVSIEGTAKGGTPGWFRGYTIIQDKTIHQLLIHAYNGAQNDHAEAIDTLRRGYRLLNGAGPLEPAPPGGFTKAEDAPGGGAGGPGGAPKEEGRTMVFPSHNLRWTLPEPSPFKWQNATTNEPEKDQQLLQAIASLPREKPEAGEANQNTALVTLKVRPLKEGQTAAFIVGNDGVQNDISKQVFQGTPDHSRTKIDADRKVGNHRGASVTMAASRDKVVHYFIFVVVTLKDTEYQFQTKLEGGKDVTQAFGKELAALLNGVEFPDTKEGIRGPLAGGAVQAHNADRGEDADKEVERAYPGMLTKKPKGLATLKAEGDSALRFAWESRSADGKSYFFWDAHTFDAGEMIKAKKTPESIVKDREVQWRSGAGDSALTVTKGKEPWFDSAFGAEKGLGYRFTGALDAHPYVEVGWVFKVKGTYFWIRAQFGGEGAEKTMDAPFKAAKKAIKFS